MINGDTILIAHLGYPTKSFRAPMIYNPYFEKIGFDAIVMPMGVKAEDYAEVLKELFARAKADISWGRARLLWAAAASGRRSPRLWQRRVSAGSAFSMPIPLRLLHS